MSNGNSTVAQLKHDSIEFAVDRDGDRLIHTIRGFGETLTSAEADGVDTPVFTECHQQGELVFLSGAVKDQLWSMSVEPIEGGMRFDVACRAKSPMDAIGTTYRVSGRERLIVIGKATADSEPPHLETRPDTFQVVSRNPPEHFPGTIRYAYAVVKKNRDWISESPAHQ